MQTRVKCEWRMVLALVAALLVMVDTLSATKPYDDASTSSSLADELRSLIESSNSHDIDDKLAKRLEHVAAAKQVEVLVPLLTHPARDAPKARYCFGVMYYLGKHVGDPVVPAMIAMLDDSDAGRREAAAHVLMYVAHFAQHRHRHPWGAEAVKKLGVLAAADPDAEVRKRAASAISSLGADAASAVEPLLRMLASEDTEIRHAGICMIDEIGIAAWPAVPQLRERLRDPKQESKQWIAEGLGAMGPAGRDAIPELLGMLTEPYSEKDNAHLMANNALFSIGLDQMKPEHLPLLRKAVVSSQYAAPAWGISRLVQPGDRASAEALIEALESQRSANIGWGAADALVKIGLRDEKTLGRLLALSKEKSSASGLWAAYAYSQLTGEMQLVLDATEQALQSGDEGVLATAADVVLALGPAAASLAPRLRVEPEARFPWLSIAMARAHFHATGHAQRHMDFLRHEMVPRSANAASDDAGVVLAEMGPLAESAVPTLIQTLQARGAYDRHARFHATNVLKHIGPGTEAEKALPELMTLLEYEDSPYNRRIVAEAIWAITRDAEVVVPALVKTLEDRGRNYFYSMAVLARLGPHAKAALPAIRKALDDPNPYFRESAAAALVALETPRPSPPTEPEQFEKLWHALGDINGEVAVDAVWQLYEGGEAAAQFLRARLAGTGPLPPDIDTLLKQLDDDSFYEREAATIALTKLLPVARPYLSAAHKAAKSAEVRMRLKRILADEGQPSIDPQTARRDARAEQALRLLTKPR